MTRLLALWLGAGAQVAWGHAPFPGPWTSCRSPDRTHLVRWVEPGSEADQHHLFLGVMQHPGETEILAFPRHIEVFWSPSSAHLAVTNDWASDESTVLLWTTLDAPPSDLLDELAAQEGQRVALWGAHHLYLEAKGWTGDGRLRLRLWGHGDRAHALDRRYVYTVGRGFSRE